MCPALTLRRQRPQGCCSYAPDQCKGRVGGEDLRLSTNAATRWASIDSCLCAGRRWWRRRSPPLAVTADVFFDGMRGAHHRWTVPGGTRPTACHGISLQLANTASGPRRAPPGWMQLISAESAHTARMSAGSSSRNAPVATRALGSESHELPRISESAGERCCQPVETVRSITLSSKSAGSGIEQVVVSALLLAFMILRTLSISECRPSENRAAPQCGYTGTIGMPVSARWRTP